MKFQLPKIKPLGFKMPSGPASLMKKISLPPLPFPLPFKKTVSVVMVVEVGDQNLKIAVASAGKILALESSQIEGISDLEIAQKIAEFLKKLEVKPTEFLIAHPAHNLTTRILSLPSIDPAEIKDIVELQAVKQTPYSRDEITTGFHIIDHDASGYSRVVVAIAHREVASRYFKILELAGIYHSQMTVSMEGTRFWFKTFCDQNKFSPEETILLLDMDWILTDLHVLSKGEIVFSRSLGAGAKNLMEQGAAIEGEFVKEIQRSLESSITELKGEVVGRIVLTGINKPLKDFCALLVRETNLPCEVVSNVRELPSAMASESLEGIEDQNTASFVTVSGLALHPHAVTVDLTPPEILFRKNLEQRGKDLAMMGTLLLAFISLVSLICVEKIYKKNNYLSELQKEYRGVQSEAEGVERLVAKMKLADDQSVAGGGILDVVRTITEVIPDNIILSSLNYDGTEKNVVIRGVSSEMSGVFNFLTTLEGTSVLEQVKTRNVTKRKVEDKDLAEFEISASIQAENLMAAEGGAAMPVGAAAPEIAGAK